MTRTPTLACLWFASVLSSLGAESLIYKTVDGTPLIKREPTQTQ